MTIEEVMLERLLPRYERVAADWPADAASTTVDEALAYVRKALAAQPAPPEGRIPH